jgi:hypothetical protein
MDTVHSPYFISTPMYSVVLPLSTWVISILPAVQLQARRHVGFSSVVLMFCATANPQHLGKISTLPIFCARPVP